MSHSTAQEQAIQDAQWGIGPPTILVGTHLALCTADPEDGVGVSLASRIPRGTFARQPGKVNNRTRTANVGPRVFTNDTPDPINASHICSMTTDTPGTGEVVDIMPLPSPRLIPPGGTFTYADGTIRFDVG